MAFPTYINKGTFQSVTIVGGAAPNLPASIENGDLLIAVVSTPNDNTLASADGDWTLLTNIGTGTTATQGAIDVWVWYAIYNGESLGGFSTASARLKCQQVYAFRNAAVPTVSATGVQATNATAWTLPSITTTSADSFVFFAIGNDRDATSTANVNGYTNANLANITELHDQVVNTGVGGGLATVYAEKATIGSTGTTSATSAASETAAFATFAISAPLSFSITADGGTFTYAGNNATLTYTPALNNYSITADTGSFTYSGNNANTRFNRKVVAEAGAYSYSGNNANVLFNRDVIAETGSFTYSGNNATLTYVSVNNYTVTAIALSSG